MVLIALLKVVARARQRFRIGIRSITIVQEGAEGSVVSIDLSTVRFSQRYVSYLKTSGTAQYTYSDIVDSMKTEEWSGDSIDIVRMSDGQLTTIDNIRVLAAREAGINLKAKIWDYDEAPPKNMLRRFEDPNSPGAFANTWGEAINMRVGR